MKLFNKSNKPSKWKRRDLIMLFERLHLYIASGLTLNKSLILLTEGLKSKQKICMERMIVSVESGNKLSTAFREEIRMSSTVLSLVEYGEIRGDLDKSLIQAGLLMEREDELIKKCVSAMIYPVAIGIFALILTLILMKGIMPQIVPMLKSLHVKLPLVTRIIIFISDNISSYGVALLELCIGSLIGFTAASKRFPGVRIQLQRCLLVIPIIGHMVYVYFVSIFIRSIGSLIDSGMSAHDAYERVVHSLSLLPLKKEFHAHVSNVKKGISLGAVFKTIRSLPRYVAPLVSAGEMSGSLGSSLLRCADILNRDIENDIKSLTSLIEPIMMAGMGLMVGTIAVSIMMPIYDISKVLQH
jgi:type II secretory pathway component PulF